jgi:agmatinase
MDVLGGAGPAPGDILGELAEPIGMSDYEVIRVAHEIGKRGLDGLSFICIPPGSAVIYRTIVYVIMYMLAGKVMGGRSAAPVKARSRTSRAPRTARAPRRGRRGP